MPTQRPVIRNAADRERVRKRIMEGRLHYAINTATGKPNRIGADIMNDLCGPAPKKKPAASGGKRKAK